MGYKKSSPDWPTIQWSKSKLEVFKERYRVAKESNEEVFKFNGHEFYTPFAHYLIEYLEGKMSA